MISTISQSHLHLNSENSWSKKRKAQLDLSTDSLLYCFFIFLKYRGPKNSIYFTKNYNGSCSKWTQFIHMSI